MGKLFNFSKFIHFSVKSVLLLVPLITFSACNARVGEQQADEAKERYVLLGLVGYNYSDRHISDYTVDGAGGSDVILSSPTSGGSGITCCVKLSKTFTGPLRLKVRWQVDGCTYVESNPITGATGKVRHFYYKETEVDAVRVAGNDPSYIETHFFPDGSVRVQVTENISKPLLVLDQRRPDKSLFPRCKDDKEPAE